MPALTRAFCAKVFLMLVATMLVLYASNQTLLLHFGSTELKRVFAERHLQQHLQWSRRDALHPDAGTLKLELLQSMRTAQADEVMVITLPLDDEATQSPSRLPLPPGFEQASVKPGPVGRHFPLIAFATIELDGKRWDATRLIAHDRVVVSLIDQTASERGVDEFLEFQQRIIRQTMPLVILLAVTFAVFLSRRVLAPARRAQESLQRPD